jgi:hypothetical protein
VILWNLEIVTIDRSFSIVGSITAHFKVIGYTKEGEIMNVYGAQSLQEKQNFLKQIHSVKSLLNAQLGVGRRLQYDPDTGGENWGH